mmetsp:Transcript_21964/g.21169  ORF Transcript_21964/g.21169 Transcript_21964/m.21169 type:complete len:106 (-) Transcript_21964:1247-1564(-)
MAERVMRSKVLFFDSNPSGKILTRFSKDIMVLDSLVLLLTLVAFTGLLRTFSVAISSVVVNPYMLIAFLLCFLAFIGIFRYIRRPLREAQRFDSFYRGPLHQNIV